jgi:hypothetical protein
VEEETTTEYKLPTTLESAKPLEMSFEQRQVAELLVTKTPQRVSEITGVPLSAIKRWKKHPDFKKYMNDFVLDLAKDMRAYHLQLCYQMLEARVEKIEELGDFSMLSSKDTLDIMESMRKASDTSGEKEQSHYMKTIEALISKSAKPSITFNVDGGTKE